MVTEQPNTENEKEREIWNRARMNQNEMGEESFIFFLWEFISFFPSSELRNLKGGNGFGLVLLGNLCV